MRRLRLFCLHREISSKKNKTAPNTPKNESGLTQMIIMGESIRQIWVKMPWNEMDHGLGLGRYKPHFTTTENDLRLKRNFHAVDLYLRYTYEPQREKTGLKDF